MNRKDGEYVLWGVRHGHPDWAEAILSRDPERFEEIQMLAALDGWGRFRIAKVDLTTPPDFAGTVNR